MMSYCLCPRCGSSALERLKSYSHCVECLYFEDYYRDPESDLAAAERQLREPKIEPVQNEPAINLPQEIEPELDAVGA